MTETHHDSVAHAFAGGFGVVAEGCAKCILDAMPTLTQTYAVAYDDPTPYMDGTRTIRQREVADPEVADAMLTVLTERSAKAPKTNLHIETRWVSDWVTSEPSVAPPD